MTAQHVTSHIQTIFFSIRIARPPTFINGPCYNNPTELSQAMEDMGVRYITTSLYYYQSNGLVEMYAQPVKSMLSKAKETDENPHFS